MAWGCFSVFMRTWCRLGGDAALAEAIVATQLGERFDHEEYWSLAVRFLIDNPDLGIDNVGGAVEYLHFQRHLLRKLALTKRSKRRVAEEFLDKIRAWQAHPPMPTRPALAWKRSGIAGLEHRDERRIWNPACWTIREHLNSNELQEEGRTMRHCVGSYGWRCVAGLSTIWSLTCSDTVSQCRRELTIEVNPRVRRIVQVKGCGNSTPTLEARKVMLRWASQVDLSVEAWV